MEEGLQGLLMGAVLVMFLIYLIALAATRDIATDFDITNAAVRRIRKEKNI